MLRRYLQCAGCLTAITASLFLAACGVTSAGGTSSAGTPAGSTPTQTTACGATPATSAGPISSSQVVALASDKTRYAPCDVIGVTITNDSATAIFVTDHHTDCSVVILQRSVNGVWQDDVHCPLGLRTRTLEIQAHASLKQLLRPSQGYAGASWPVGTYRLYLPYTETAISSQQPIQAFSATFVIA